MKYNHKDQSFFGALGVSDARFEEIMAAHKKVVEFVIEFYDGKASLSQIVEATQKEANMIDVQEFFTLGTIMGMAMGIAGLKGTIHSLVDFLQKEKTVLKN